MLVERHCNKWDSALRNKNKKTHHNSCRAQRKPEGEAREEEGGKNESQVGIYPVFHVFNPGPFLHTPGTKSVSGVEVGGGPGWYQRREARSGTHCQHFTVSLSAKARVKKAPPPKKIEFRPSVASLRRVFSSPSWMLNPRVYPLYPGASADYSSPPCCVSVCIGRMGSGERIPRPGPVSSPLCFSVARSDTCWPRSTLHLPHCSGPHQCYLTQHWGPETCSDWW